VASVPNSKCLGRAAVSYELVCNSHDKRLDGIRSNERVA
jgi:hypothetical protein